MCIRTYEDYLIMPNFYFYNVAVEYNGANVYNIYLSDDITIRCADIIPAHVSLLKKYAEVQHKLLNASDINPQNINISPELLNQRILNWQTLHIKPREFAMISAKDIKGLQEYNKEKIEFQNTLHDYDIRYMRLAREFSTWSKDPRAKIGAVAVDTESKMILSQGYNGFPRNIKDDHRLYIRELKLRHIVHAEMNVVYNATANGVNLKNSTLYVYGLPVCCDCANAIIQTGIKRVVMCDVKNSETWNDSFKITQSKFDECGIEYTFIKKEELN